MSTLADIAPFLFPVPGLLARSRHRAGEEEHEQERRDWEAEADARAARSALLRGMMEGRERLAPMLSGNLLERAGQMRSAAPQTPRFDWEGLLGGVGTSAIQGLGGLSASNREPAAIPDWVWEILGQSRPGGQGSAVPGGYGQ